MTRRGRGRRGPMAKYYDFNVVPNPKIIDDNCPRVTFIIHLFKCPCNAEWESPLLGSQNGEECMNRQCRKNGVILPFSRVEGTTPCQIANKRSFGMFQCHKCNRYWKSAYSWTNKSQKCQNCDINIYPFNQTALRRQRGESGSEKSHQRHRCQMCRELGKECGKTEYSKSNRLSRTRSGRQKRSKVPNQVDSLSNVLQKLII